MKRVLSQNYCVIRTDRLARNGRVVNNGQLSAHAVSANALASMRL